jgi:uncharacterized protein (DUF983 family)
MTILCLIVISAFIAVIASAMGKCPLWVPVLLSIIAQLLGCLALR